ncbi:MAG: hypothetical protein HYZ01_02080 [Ignavibacteriales bacterium]|nr:hypothetical protein [Ignavibacteriales bacterium]
MNRGRYGSFTRFMMLFAIGLAGLVPMGCDKENPVDEDESFLSADLFPLAVGRILVFTTYDLDAQTGQKVESTVHRDVSYFQATVTIGGRSAFRLIDSIYTPQGTIERIDTSYIAVNNGDVSLWEGGGENEWFDFVQRSAGLNNEYIIRQYQETEDGVTLNVTIKGKFYDKESVTVPIGTVDAYKLEIKVSIQAGTFSSDWIDQYLYFAEGYGPVRMTFPSQTIPGTTEKAPGEESLLVSKNF